MAPFHSGVQACPLCGQVMQEGDDLIGFTFLGSTDPLIRQVDDEVVHRSCLSNWEHRDAFAKAWNEEIRHTPLAHSDQLVVDDAGQVRYESDQG